MPADALEQFARETIARGSLSFALASRLFDRPTRRRAVLLYAWCRHCDDVIDGQVLGRGRDEAADAPQLRLAALETGTARALAGAAGLEPPFAAIAEVAREAGIPACYPRDLLAGFAFDVGGAGIDDEADLLRYCYHVAGVVGIMMALAMGVPADQHETLARASDLGIAFQLNNIARDIIEDAAIGRCYLPRRWLEQEGTDPYDAASAPALFRLCRRLVALAAPYRQSALHGTPALPWRSAWAVLAAAQIYGGIGRLRIALGPQRLGVRATVPGVAKAGAVVLALGQALGRGRLWPVPHPPRLGLWTPPALVSPEAF
jgi:phytoene synthase